MASNKTDGHGMFKIGEFSKLTQVSIRMLRHYDELGLLIPAHTDPTSGYRFYTAQQLTRLNRIRALQDLGLSLEQIGILLTDDLSPAEFRAMLLLKQAEVQDRIAQEQARLARIALRLQQIEQANDAYDIRLKKLDAQWVASLRDSIEAYDEIGVLYQEIYAVLPKYALEGIAAAVWHDESYRERQIDAEALIFLNGPVEVSPSRVQINSRVQIKQLPAVQVMSVVHEGAIDRIELAYQAVMQWIEQQSYRISGPNRELYLHVAMPFRADDVSSVTEIQFPIMPSSPPDPLSTE